MDKPKSKFQKGGYVIKPAKIFFQGEVVILSGPSEIRKVNDLIINKLNA